ncbi:MAG: hypothetical protein F6K09_03975, partial [Merismopedia sp. SIO2A8]|nr:hypothetical protein [Merismopedia sp. SIO2A8]
MTAQSSPQPLDASTSSALTTSTTSFISAWTFFLTLLVGCATSGSTAAIAFLYLMSLPPEADCQQSSTIKTDRQWFDCTHQAFQQGALDPVVNGLAVVGTWIPTDPLYYEAQSSLEQWSKHVLKAAQQKAETDDVEAAIALVRHIPHGSPLYDDAQTVIAAWQQKQNTAETIVAIAQEALKQQDWDQVEQHLQALESLAFGTEKAKDTGATFQNPKSKIPSDVKPSHSIEAINPTGEAEETGQNPKSKIHNSQGLRYLRQLSTQLQMEKASVHALRD